jgi:hypothetical protein
MRQMVPVAGGVLVVGGILLGLWSRPTMVRHHRHSVRPMPRRRGRSRGRVRSSVGPITTALLCSARERQPPHRRRDRASLTRDE